jgi:hypothetical protein
MAGVFSLPGSDEQIFGLDKQVPGRGPKQPRSEKAAPQRIPWDQMKPRTVYDKAVQDFTETARRLARLDQHFRQASFAEFKMLMAFEAFDDEALKRYGLSKPMVERVLLKVYQTVVLGPQRYRDQS